MSNIYGIKIHNKMDNETFNYLLNFISSEKQERIKRFKFFNDAQRCLLGEMLARYAICRRLSVENTQLSFGSNEYGKPILLKLKGLHFNISHSSDWVVCAVDNETVGIDVEVIKPIDFNIARRFFSADEYSDLISKDRDEKIKYFYKLWTLKESYIKAIGKGLSIPLNSFSFKIEDEEITINTNNEFGPCSFWQYDIDENHIVSVCSLNKGFKPDIKVISLSQLLSL